MTDNEAFENLKKRLAEKMAGEITLSEKPGECLKKWRLNFEVSQTDISNSLQVSPSVISDYESGRRKSPGTLMVSKIVESLLAIDTERGGQKIHAYETMLTSDSSKESIYSTYEYSIPVQFQKLVSLLDAHVLYRGMERPLYGFSVVDSKRSILEMTSYEFQRLYGWSTDRAMVFTRVSTGKSPLVAIRVTNLKPGAIVLHGLSKDEVDPMAIKMAEVDRVPLLCTTKDLDEAITELKKYGQYSIKGI